MKSGSWDSIHVVEAVEANNKTSATYKLTTTIMLSMSVEKQEVGETLLSGSLTRQVCYNILSCRLSIIQNLLSRRSTTPVYLRRKLTFRTLDA